MPALRSQLVAQRSGTVTIDQNETVSTAFDSRGFSSFGLLMPSSFTGTTISFQVSHDNSTYNALNNTTGSVISMTVAASKAYSLPIELTPWRYFKIVSGSSEAAARTLTLMASSA